MKFFFHLILITFFIAVDANAFCPLAKSLCEAPDTTPYCGMGHGYFNAFDGAICRGGDWDYPVMGGVFAVNFYVNERLEYNSLGFRCVYLL